VVDVWNSHGDKLTKLPKGFRSVGCTDNSAFAAIEEPKRRFYGLQFHPEVVHTPRGKDILQNFVYEICQCSMDWTMGGFIDEACEQVRAQVGDAHVILGLSGGRGFQRGCGSSAQGDRRSAYLRLCKQRAAPRARGGVGEARLWRQFPHEAKVCGC
jgi:hypothetical protein